MDRVPDYPFAEAILSTTGPSFVAFQLAEGRGDVWINPAHVRAFGRAGINSTWIDLGGAEPNLYVIGAVEEVASKLGAV